MVMARFSWLILTLCLVLVGHFVSAQVQYCSSEDTCIAISIPENQKTVETSFFVSLQAPASAKWFAFGFGSQMAGSLILVAWPYNNEVIVSIRLATGHSLPPVYNGPDVQVLESSANSSLSTIQLKCTNCTQWSTGNLNLESVSANMIWAYGTTAPSNPSQSSSSFTQHTDNGVFNLNLQQAATTSTTPPTIHSSSSTTSSGSTDWFEGRHLIIFIHAVLMALVWVLLFPLGAVLIRFFHSVNKHRVVQIFTLLVLLGAGGVGVYLAWGNQFSSFHEVFGITIIGAAIVQAVFGGYHHYRYVRDKPAKRRWFTHVHLWLGRVLILCGLANCGFGLLIAQVSLHWAIIWWIASGGLALLYFFFYVVMALCQRRAKNKARVVPYGQAPPDDSYEMLNQPGLRYPKGPYESSAYDPSRYGSQEHLAYSAAPDPSSKYEPFRHQDIAEPSPYSEQRPSSRAEYRDDVR